MKVRIIFNPKMSEDYRYRLEYTTGTNFITAFFIGWSAMYDKSHLSLLSDNKHYFRTKELAIESAMANIPLYLAIFQKRKEEEKRRKELPEKSIVWKWP